MLAGTLLLTGCRVPVRGFRELGETPPSTVERVVLSCPDSQTVHETRDPRLIARLLAGIRVASRPRDDQTTEAVSPFYLVLYRGKPVRLGLMLGRAEVHYGPDFAAAVGDLLKTPSKSLYDAASELSALERASR